ncbi:MAG: VolA/Pla-1 family phospholipase [Vibrio anguillarum]
MLKTTFKISLLCSALWLIGCGDETNSSGASTTPTYEAYIQDALKRDTSIKFTLSGANANVPLPSFALMNAKDGTLEIPTKGDDALTNPVAAMGTMDGWSTSMPLFLDFEGVGLADGLISNGIYLIELTDSMIGSPTVKNVLTLNTDFAAIASASSDKIAIVPNKALNPASEYILAVTDEITDVNGNIAGTSSSYAALKSKVKIYTDDKLGALQKVTQGVESIFALAGVDQTKIIYSTWFSTQSVGQTLYSVKGATAAGLATTDIGNIWKQGANPNNLNLSAAYTMSFGATTDFVTALNNDANFQTYIGAEKTTAKAFIENEYTTSSYHINVTTGTVKLPYYLEKGSNWNSQPFESAMPSLALIKNALADDNEKATIANQLIANNIDVTQLATSPSEQLKLVGLTLTKSDGSPLDPQRIITRYSPVPKVKSLEDVDFLLFTPNAGTNWPIVIYQHGITSVKEDAYFTAAHLANAGIAVIAIDQPLHGARSLDAQRSANADILAYLNLNNLAVARDNTRQSILDIMGLRAAITYSQSAGLFVGSQLATAANTAAMPPKFLGHSLGGIVGLSAVANANRTIGDASGDALYKFSEMAIANSGGQIGNLLMGSANYGPLIKHNLALSASPKYKAFAEQYCPGLTEKVCYTTFENTASASDKAALQSQLDQFTYATQTLLDTMDPYTNASYLISGGTATIPTYLLQVAGDESVPNNVTNTRAGTEPLATLLGLANAVPSDVITNTSKVFVKMDSGTHTTFLVPQDAADAVLRAGALSQLAIFLN